MTARNVSRRNFLKRSFVASTPVVLAAGGLPLSAAESRPSAEKSHPLRIVCVGGHPDDPESGCAGTLARYAEREHSVTIIYLTRGERGISGKTNDEAAGIRTAECE